MSQSEFETLKANLLSRKKLWEDDDFPAAPASLAVSERRSPHVVWMRPWDIARRQFSEPKFIIEGTTRFDLYQGEIGDCWFIAAVTCLAVSPAELFRRVVPLNQHFHENYAGIFRFMFWHFGRWVEVHVDDRLPTINGKLIYGCNRSQPNEFWVPLVEKAYAKLTGGYDNIGIGGHTSNALVDFTGGISETIDLRLKRSSPGDLFNVMYAMMQKCSMLACDIESRTVSSTPESNGLYKGHAYSITNIIRLKSKNDAFRLLRLRNPHGKGEWNGRWSDRSAEWYSVPDNVKQDIGLQILEDGEFWISFEDFLISFELLWMCHLEPDAVAEQISHAKHQSMWEETKYTSEWIRGYNAGGCGNPPYQRLFWRNPQFRVTIQSPSPDDRDKVSHMVVSLMQEFRMDQNFSIGVMLYEVREGAAQLLDGENYDRRALQLTQKPSKFTNLREVSVHSQLEPGEYVIIPCTFHPNEQTRFLLRVFTETAAPSEELDLQTTLDAAPTVEDNLSKIFDKYSNGALEMDATEFMHALNAVFHTNKQNEFTLDVSRNLIDMFITNNSYLVNRQQFHSIVKEVTEWKNKFEQFDKDSSEDIDTYEISDLFQSIGLRLSRQVMSSIVRRYGGKQRRLSFEDFIIVTCRINAMYQYFVKARNPHSGRLEVSLEEFLAKTV